MAERGLTRRLGRELLLQAVYISLAVGVGVFVAAALIEDVLIKQALQGEAEYYWERRAAGVDLPLPDTKNMTGYRADMGAGVPAELLPLDPGFHRLDRTEEILAYVSERDGQRLYLLFDVEQVDRLVTLFGLVPLTVALVVVYLSLYSAYRVSRRAVSPIVSLAQKVQRIDPTAPDAGLFDEDDLPEADDEIRVLTEALQDLTRRVTDFAEREQRFTRDASHELRTPLTVIDDMERLTAAFLLLARESRESLQKEWVSVNDVVEAEVERMRIVHGDSGIDSEIREEVRLMVLAPEKVVESVVGNLLRNAFAYTDEGSVNVTIKGRSVIIEDTGPGMDPDALEQVFKPFFRNERQRGGFGVGLTIVKRMSDRFGWTVEIDSEPNEGTRVTVTFPDARVAV
ncbi:MAG: HAMP domain-containing sensor histidine kinase [Gammaproteobacteria bacterium]